MRRSAIAIGAAAVAVAAVVGVVSLVNSGTDRPAPHHERAVTPSPTAPPQPSAIAAPYRPSLAEKLARMPPDEAAVTGAQLERAADLLPPDEAADLRAQLNAPANP
jgi:hypothetical protein